jgi:hypothetical protein
MRMHAYVEETLLGWLRIAAKDQEGCWPMHEGMAKMMLAQELLWCAWISEMACVSGLGMAQALGCLSTGP